MNAAGEIIDTQRRLFAAISRDPIRMTWDDIDVASAVPGDVFFCLYESSSTEFGRLGVWHGGEVLFE